MVLTMVTIDPMKLWNDFLCSLQVACSTMIVTEVILIKKGERIICKCLSLNEDYDDECDEFVWVVFVSLYLFSISVTRNCRHVCLW